MTDPNRWQPLQLEHMISQNGIPVENGVQQAVGPHWGHVIGFALPAGRHDRACRSIPGRRRSSADPATDQAYKDQAVEVIRDSSQLDAADGGDDRHLARRARGNNPLGHQRRRGSPGQPGDRPAVRAERRQAGRLRPCPDRVLGRRAEVRDAARPLERRRQRGRPTSWTRTCGSAAAATPVDRLQWDVKLYLALNGATHDAAIAAWGLKGHYDSVRPISMIRYMGGLRPVERSGRCRRTTRTACRSCPV